MTTDEAEEVETRVRALELRAVRHDTMSEVRHSENVRRFEEAATARQAMVSSLERQIAELRSIVTPMVTYIEQQKGGHKMALTILAGVSTIGGLLGGIIVKAITRGN